MGRDEHVDRSRMMLATRLNRMIAGLPDGASISLPVKWVRDLLATSAPELEQDLTVGEVAQFFGRSPVTVRAWIRDGHLKAYHFKGREYRVTASALEAFIARERGHDA